MKTGVAQYRKIALDIANKIVKGDISPRDKISGRSTLAGIYNVSPETIRRAIALLEEMEVVISNVGSGIQVRSISNAEKFIQKYKNNEYINSTRDDIVSILKKKKELDLELEENFQKIIDFIERFNNISPFVLIEVSILETCVYMGKNINEIRFWQNTGATILGYKRAGNIIVSPGPKYIFTQGDVIVVIGNTDVYIKVWKFLHEQ
ncbi:MAG: TrkA C-terminal domain-containing protein [Clostridiaceae bacterium]